MRIRREIIAAAAGLFLAASGSPHGGPLPRTFAADGTLDLAQTEAAAARAFDRINRDSDTTLDFDEAKGRLSKKAFLAADPDADKTLSKDEYIAMAAKLFSAADIDSDGVLDRKELASRAGRALMRLLQ
jgi:hypothetical protein